MVELNYSMELVSADISRIFIVAWLLLKKTLVSFTNIKRLKKQMCRHRDVDDLVEFCQL
jgi:hypothetical protein